MPAALQKLVHGHSMKGDDMDQKILPQEFVLLNDNAFIRTRCPYGKVTDEMVAMQVKRGNLVAGDPVMVQCMNHDGSAVIAEAEYRVVERHTKLETAGADTTSPRTFEHTSFRVVQLHDWRVFDKSQGDFVEGRAVWNVGMKRYDIEVDGEVVGFHADKETATRIAAGDLPLPAKAA